MTRSCSRDVSDPRAFEALGGAVSRRPRHQIRLPQEPRMKPTIIVILALMVWIAPAQFPNDGCFGSSWLTLPQTITTTNIGATLWTAFPCGFGGADLWYQFTAPFTGTATVSTCGGSTNFDTVIAILPYPCTGPYITCND